MANLLVCTTLRTIAWESDILNTSVAQSRNLVIEYAVAKITFLKHSDILARKAYVLTKAKNISFSAKKTIQIKTDWNLALVYSVNHRATVKKE